MSEQVDWRREWAHTVGRAKEHVVSSGLPLFVWALATTILAADQALRQAEAEVKRLREIERRAQLYLDALDADRREQRLRSLDDLEVQETVLRGALRAAQGATDAGKAG